MSMRIQDAFTNCCDGVKIFASEAGNWISGTASTIAKFVGESVQKVAEFIKPHFENLKTFSQENKQSIIIASIAFAIGAVATAIITQVFCRGTGNAVTTTSSTSAATV